MWWRYRKDINLYILKYSEQREWKGSNCAIRWSQAWFLISKFDSITGDRYNIRCWTKLFRYNPECLGIYVIFTYQCHYWPALHDFSTRVIKRLYFRIFNYNCSLMWQEICATSFKLFCRKLLIISRRENSFRWYTSSISISLWKTRGFSSQ